MATGSHQWKACWFLLIVPYHREIIDGLYFAACLPQTSQDRTGRKTKGTSVSVGDRLR